MAKLKEYPENGTLEEKIDWFLKIDPKTLINRDVLGEIFVESAELFSEIQTFLHRLELSEVGRVTGRWSGDLHRHLQEIKDHLDWITDPNLDVFRAKDIAKKCQRRFPEILQEMVDVSSAYGVPITRQKAVDLISADIERLTNELKTLLAQARNDAGQIKQTAAQSEQILTTAAGKVGTAAESQHFFNEADKHRKNAWWWLGGVALGGGVLLVIAGYFHFCEPLPKTGNFDWNHFVPRFSILGLLIFFEVVLIGNYKAERHNTIVNKHRANALKTFETMITAARSDGAKDAVTLTAAGAIYAPQETGFRGGGSAQMQNPAEILAAITQKPN